MPSSAQRPVASSKRTNGIVAGRSASNVAGILNESSACAPGARSRRRPLASVTTSQRQGRQAPVRQRQPVDPPAPRADPAARNRPLVAIVGVDVAGDRPRGGVSGGPAQPPGSYPERRPIGSAHNADVGARLDDEPASRL